MTDFEQSRPGAGTLERDIRRICRKFRLAELYVFGSRANEIAARVGGEAIVDGRPSTSDVDIGVRPLPAHFLDVDSLVGLADDLERCLNVSRVDVVLLPTASPFLALDIVRGELLYCADRDAQAEYELYVLRRAGDLAPFQRLRQDLALSRYEGS